MSRHHFSKICRILPLIAAITVGANQASAQPAAMCPAFPACNLDGERYDSDTGNCELGPVPPSGALSHRIPTCASGEHLDRTSGNCVLDSCGGGSCEVRPACPSGTSYDGNGTGPDGAYAVCGYSGDFGSRDHQLAYCSSGFTLNTAHGVCIGNCQPGNTYQKHFKPLPLPFPIKFLPDLTVQRVFLRPYPQGPIVKGVLAGKPYVVCFVVANIGSVSAGPFIVGGGGLSVPTPPSQSEAGLAAGASVQGCLNYPTTPPPGTYTIEVEADSGHVIHELREDNNTAAITIVVLP